MNGRIKEIRRHPKIHLSQEAFGKRLGITGSSVSLLESGRNQPSDQTIMLICREYGVNESWLRKGEGEMFRKTAQDTVREISDSHNLDDEDRVVLEEFAALRPDERKSAIRYLRRIAARLDEMEARKQASIEAQKQASAAASKSRKQEAAEVAGQVYETILGGGEKALESGKPPDGVGIA